MNTSVKSSTACQANVGFLGNGQNDDPGGTFRPTADASAFLGRMSLSPHPHSSRLRAALGALRAVTILAADEQPLVSNRHHSTDIR